MTLDTALPVPYTVQVDAFHEFSPYTPEPTTVTTTPAVFAANATAAVVTLTSTPVGTGATYYAQFPWDIVPHTEAQMNGSWRLNWAEQQITILHQ